MNEVDRNYYLARIAAEEAAAECASHPLAAQSHRKLAEEYVGLIEATDALLGGLRQAA